MGGGHYSSSDRSIRATSKGYDTKPAEQLFSSRLHPSMSPKDVKLREARDSEDHPNSFPIIIGLDLTGSMGSIPRMLIKDGLPKIVQGIIDAGIPDPQILFIGVGDHECDRAPLQVGQFESSDELIDMWLERTWLEKGGGGNDGESYHLAWYFAGMHTVHDAWEKRNQKGLLITIGDEKCLHTLPSSSIVDLMGSGQKNFKREELLELAEKTYNVFHIHMKGRGWDDEEDDWKDLIGQNLIESTVLEIPELIKKLAVKCFNKVVKSKPIVEESASKDEPEVLL